MDNKNKINNQISVLNILNNHIDLSIENGNYEVFGVPIYFHVLRGLFVTFMPPPLLNNWVNVIQDDKVNNSDIDYTLVQVNIEICRYYIEVICKSKEPSFENKFSNYLSEYEDRKKVVYLFLLLKKILDKLKSLNLKDTKMIEVTVKPDGDFNYKYYNISLDFDNDGWLNFLLQSLSRFDDNSVLNTYLQNYNCKKDGFYQDAKTKFGNAMKSNNKGCLGIISLPIIASVLYELIIRF